MQIPRKQHRKRRFSGCSANSCVRHRAEYKDHVWSYDFVTDRTEEGRQFRILVVVDEYTRECLALEAAGSFTSQDVVGVLQYLFAVRGTPQHIRSDNGPEFIAVEVQQWLGKMGIGTIYIEPGSPWQNGHVESFHNRLRDECLNQEIFLSVTEARVVIEEWRCFYNRVHPHSRLGFKSPEDYARRAARPGLLCAAAMPPL